MIDIVQYQETLFEGVRALWEQAYPDDPPWNRAEHVIPAKVASQPSLLLVAVMEPDVVIGSALAGYDGHRGWLYSVAVQPPFQRQGVGTRMVRMMEERLYLLGCPKINLQVLSLNIALIRFYHSLGYSVEGRVSMGKRIHGLCPDRD